MMERFSNNKHGNIIKNLPFSYFSHPLYLEFAAYVFYRNNEPVIVWQDLIYPHDFPSIFLPSAKKNWVRTSIALARKTDIEKIREENIEIRLDVPGETEYFYKTQDFVNPTGGKKKEINRFEKNYNFKIRKNYPKDKILNFYRNWAGQRPRQEELTYEESEELFNFTLEKLDEWQIKQIYVEEKDRLIGLAWGIQSNDNKWTSLQLKVDYEYKGLSHFIRSELAKEFSPNEIFTTGTGCHHKGIAQYKKQLGPYQIVNYHYILTGDKG